MALTQKLKEFWSRLNQGKIEWHLIYNEMSANERKEAVDMLFKRGFVVLAHEKDLMDCGIANVYVVLIDREIICPKEGDKIWCFTAEKYAEEYKKYLAKDKKLEIYVDGRLMSKEQNY